MFRLSDLSKQHGFLGLVDVVGGACTCDYVPSVLCCYPEVCSDKVYSTYFEMKICYVQCQFCTERGTSPKM